MHLLSHWWKPKLHCALAVMICGSLWSTQNLVGQNFQTEIDSLKAAMVGLPMSQKATIYNELSYAFRRVSADSAENYAELALEVARHHKDLKNEAHAYKNLGIAKYKNGTNYQEAIEVFEKAQQLAVRTGDYPLQASCLNSIGKVYHTLFRLETSLTYFFQGLELYSKPYIEEEDFVKGLLLANIATTHRRLKNYEKALEYFDKTFTFGKTKGFSRLRIIYCDDHAETLIEMGQLEEARNICATCLEEADALKDHQSVLQSRNTLATIHLHRQEYKEALTMSQKSEEFAVTGNFDVEYAEALVIQAQALRGLGMSLSAIDKALESHAHARDGHKLLQTAEISQLLSSLYEETGDYKRALQYEREFNHWSSAENDQASQAQAAELEAKYDNRYYVRENEILAQEKKLTDRSLRLYLVALALAIPMLFLFAFLFASRRKALRKMSSQHDQLQETQSTLKQSNSELQRILKNSQEGITYTDAKSRRMISCNRQMLKLLQAGDFSEVQDLMPEEMLVDPVIEGLPVAEFMEKYMEELEKTGHSGATFRLRRLTGDPIWVKMIATVDAFDPRNPRVISFFTNINEEQAAKLALERKNLDLQKYIESNIQLEQFAHVASHDLRAPIITIKGFTELLERRLTLKADSDEYNFLQYIKQNAMQMFELVTDLLEYSKIDSQKLRTSPISSHDVVSQVFDLYKAQQIEKEITMKIKGDLPVVTADAIKLKRVFQNLVGNAVKFSDPEKQSLIEVWSEMRNGTCTFHVRDNGIGIDAHGIDIFLPYQQLHRKEDYRGSGLGLSICKKIIEQHGGEISFSSEAGKWTEFKFTIPQSDLIAQVA